MKNLKKYLALIVAVAMLVTTMVPALAADEFTYEAEAEALYNVGLFQGRSLTVYEPDLGASLTREEGITLLIRLLGLEEGVEALTDEEAEDALAKYEDADEVGNWAKKYMAYTVIEELVQGTTPTTLSPKASLDGRTFATMILRAIGYEVDAEAWSTAATMLQEKGGLTEEQAEFFNKKTLIRDDVVGISYGALNAKYADEDVTVIEKLIELEVVSEEDAKSVGIIPNPITAIADVEAVSVAIGGTVELPETVTVTYEDETTADVAVVWGEVDTSAAGTFVIEGTVEGTELKATVEVTVEPETLEITAEATAADVVTVTFNKAMDAETVIALNYGYVPMDVTVEYAEDGKSATLTSEDSFMAGDYTVVVGEGEAAVEAEVTIEDQEMASFSITTEVLTQDATQPLKYEAVDQYGNVFDYDAVYFTPNAFNATAGSAVTITGNGTEFSVTGLNTAAIDDTIVISLVHKTTGVSQSKSFTLKAAKAVDVVEFGTPAPKEDADRIETNDTSDELVLPMTLKNQYGTEMDITSGILASDITFISSNTAIVNPTSFAVNADGEVTYQTGATAGKVTISAITKKTGKTSTVTFEVFTPAAIKSLSFQQPAGLVVAGEAVTVTYTAKDIYDAAMDLSSTSEGGKLTWFSTDSAIVDTTTDIAVDDDGVLTITPQTEGTVSINAYVSGQLQGTISLNVKATAVATKITKLADDTITTVAKTAGKVGYTVDNFVIVDQYNRVMASDDLTGLLTITEKTPADNYVGVSVVSGVYTVTSTGSGAGSQVMTATYGTATKDFTVTVVADANVVDYKLTEIDNKSLYSNNFANEAAAAGYARAFTIEYGLTENGTKVGLSDGEATDILLTTTSSEVTLDNTTNEVFAAGTSDGETAVVTAWKKGKKIAEVEFTTSNTAPYVASIEVAEASYTVTTPLDLKEVVSSEYTQLTVKDQYGVADTLSGETWFTSDAAVATVANGVVTKVAAGEATITVVTATGVTATTKVVVE